MEIMTEAPARDGLAPTVHDARRAAEVLPGSVMLFGSVARGEAGPWSDIDLMCVVDDVETSERAGMELALLKRARRACGRQVEVVLTDWPGWLSWKEWPSTLEHSASRDGMWLKRQTPGPGVDWNKKMVPQRIRSAAVAASLHNTYTNLSQALYAMTPSSEEIGIARDQEQEEYWSAVWVRLGGINSHLHMAVEQSLVVLCHLIGAPYSIASHNLLPLYHNLKRYGLDDLDSWLEGIDLEWVEAWRAGVSHRADLERSEDTTWELSRASATVADQTANLASLLVENTVAYTEAVVTISEAAVAIVEGRVSKSEIPNTEDLRTGINRVRRTVASIYDQMSSRYWLYPDGTPPHGWKPPW